ncbi:MAG: AEC family transporter [Chloroflexi bacterium]|nr:AEC family transporter [Chloroflexota bacterium]
MLNIFLTVVLPIFLVAGAGAALQRVRPGPLGMLAPASLYIFAPALALDGLLRTQLPLDVSLRIVASAASVLLAMAVVSWVVSRILRLDRTTESGFMLTGTFGNAGNMGIPVSFLAFGDDGLAVAIMVFITQSSISWPIGIYIAARGRTRGWAPLLIAVRAPVLYVVPVALVVRALDWTVPVAIERPISLLADAAIPGMLLVLGYQLALGIAFDRPGGIAAALVTRLVVGAVAGAAIATVLGLDGVVRNTVVLIAAMPAAVFITILATEYRTAPRFVATVVVTSTVAGLATLAVVINLLQRWD